MKTAYLTRKKRFSAAHRYWRPEWTSEENVRMFGACANPHGHGHNYMLEVMVAAEIDAKTGFSADLPALDAILDREIIRLVDHQHLNHAIPEFAAGKLVPTCENILAWCWPRIAGALPPTMKLHRLRLHEDDTFYVDFFG